MSSTVFSLEKHFQTQPPLHLSDSKVGSVLEYLAFSGNTIYIQIFDKSEMPFSTQVSAVVLDVLNESLIARVQNLKQKVELPAKIRVAFGYKRKRAEFESKIISIADQTLTLEKPIRLTLNNLRRNPRLKVASDFQRLNPITKLRAKTAVGIIEIGNAQINEISQLGMSVFLDRTPGLVLPGDRIESFEVEVDGARVFQVSGIVSRVDMKRTSENIANSYEAIVLFQRDQPMKLGPIARSAKRIPILENKPCFLSAEHPFFPGRKVDGQLMEISSSGFTCILERTNVPVIPGMRFKKCSLQLPHKPSREFVFEVKHVEFKSDGENNHFKLGAEFVSAPVELHKDISSYTQEARGGIIQDVTEDDFDLLWEFLFETNFIYQSKRKQIQNKSREILETYHRLISTDNPIVKKVVFKEESEIKGHLSALRYYDHTWIFQHLNALKSSKGSPAQAVLGAMIDFFYDTKANFRNETFYIMTFFRPDNLYPAILFGESCRRMNDPQNASLIDFSFGTIDTLASPPRTDGIPKPEIQTDLPESYQGLSDLLIQRGLFSFLRAIGLAQTMSGKLEIQNAYTALGLERKRHLLSAKRDDSEVFALVEIASAGLNLSELTNAIFVFTHGSDLNLNSMLAEQLVAEAVQKYFEPRDINPVVLQPLNESRPTNVSWSKVYTCWANSAAGFPAFEAASRSVLNEFPTLIEAFRNTQKFGDGIGTKIA